MIGTGTFYDQITECAYDLKLTLCDDCNNNNNNTLSIHSGNLKYLFQLQDHIQTFHEEDSHTMEYNDNLTFENITLAM